MTGFLALFTGGGGLAVEPGREAPVSPRPPVAEPEYAALAGEWEFVSYAFDGRKDIPLEKADASRMLTVYRNEGWSPPWVITADFPDIVRGELRYEGAYGTFSSIGAIRGERLFDVIAPNVFTLSSLWFFAYRVDGERMTLRALPLPDEGRRDRLLEGLHGKMMTTHNLLSLHENPRQMLVAAKGDGKVVFNLVRRVKPMPDYGLPPWRVDGPGSRLWSPDAPPQANNPECQALRGVWILASYDFDGRSAIPISAPTNVILTPWPPEILRIEREEGRLFANVDLRIATLNLYVTSPKYADLRGSDAQGTLSFDASGRPKLMRCGEMRIAYQIDGNRMKLRKVARRDEDRRTCLVAGKGDGRVVLNLVRKEVKEQDAPKREEKPAQKRSGNRRVY
jgi:hypothetical protein